MIQKIDAGMLTFAQTPCKYLDFNLKKGFVKIKPESRKESTMIGDMLKRESIQVLEKAKDWKDAIHLSLQALVKGGYVTDNYEKAIIKTTEEYGPYYVLARDLALIHARPTDGVIKRQLAVTLLKEPVIFIDESDSAGENYPVRILIALAATDSNSHLDTLNVLSGIFIDEEKIKELADAKDPDQIFDLLIEAEANIK